MADVLTTTAASVSAVLSGRATPGVQDTAAAGVALEQVRDFLSELKEPSETEAERFRMTSTLHALDHTSRLVGVLAGGWPPGRSAGVPQDLRAAELCTQAMRATQTAGVAITSESALSMQAETISWNVSPEVAVALAEVEGAARELDALQRDYRATTLASVAPGRLTAADAFKRIDAAQELDRIAHHAWHSAAHLFGRGDA